MFDLVTPARALIVGLAGMVLAWLWFRGNLVPAIVLAVLAALAGLAFDWLARRRLPDHPVSAVWLLEGWILTPATLAAVGSAIVVVVTVALTIPAGSKLETDAKELIGTLSTGLTAFVTAAFISWASDDKDSMLADHIREAFRSKYDRAGGDQQAGIHYFPPESAGERWVFSDEYRGIEGWGRAARIRRAHGVAEELTK
jgi:hypothetical protein